MCVHEMHAQILCVCVSVHVCLRRSAALTFAAWSKNIKKNKIKSNFLIFSAAKLRDDVCNLKWPRSQQLQASSFHTCFGCFCWTGENRTHICNSIHYTNLAECNKSWSAGVLPLNGSNREGHGVLSMYRSHPNTLWSTVLLGAIRDACSHEL